MRNCEVEEIYPRIHADIDQTADGPLPSIC